MLFLDTTNGDTDRTIVAARWIHNSGIEGEAIAVALWVRRSTPIVAVAAHAAHAATAAAAIAGGREPVVIIRSSAIG